MPIHRYSEGLQATSSARILTRACINPGSDIAIWDAKPRFGGAFFGALVVLLALEFKRSQDSVILSILTHWSPHYRRLLKRTYLKYRDDPFVFLNKFELIDHLEKRYRCSAFKFGQRRIPVTIVWENLDQIIEQNELRGDKTVLFWNTHNAHKIEVDPKFQADVPPALQTHLGNSEIAVIKAESGS